MQPVQPSTNPNIQGGNVSDFVPKLDYNSANEETRNAKMPVTVGLLPLTLRAGNPLITYKLDKIETPSPEADYIYFHLEKYCPLDALWYHQWTKLSL